jgi:hypothetical protein
VPLVVTGNGTGGIEWGRRGGDRRRPRAGRDSWVSNATDADQLDECRDAGIKRRFTRMAKIRQALTNATPKRSQLTPPSGRQPITVFLRADLGLGPQVSKGLVSSQTVVPIGPKAKLKF